MKRSIAEVGWSGGGYWLKTPILKGFVNSRGLLSVLAGCNETPDADDVGKAGHAAKTSAFNALRSACMLLCYLVSDVERV